MEKITNLSQETIEQINNTVDENEIIRIRLENQIIEMLEMLEATLLFDKTPLGLPTAHSQNKKHMPHKAYVT